MTLVPSCSACGQSVDWLRSCYSSEWFLLSGQGRPFSEGRYYFSPEGTPFYSGVTCLTSRIWHDRNALIVQGLGESLTAKQKWDNGALPALVPLNETVGSPSCIGTGESPEKAIEAQELVSGFVAECFVARPAPIDPWPTMSAYQSCSIQVAYAKIISWLYDNRVADITNVISNLLGPTYTLTHFPGTVSLPDVYVAVSAEASFLWSDGTSTFQQIALQGAYVLVPPVNQGIFGTLPLWYAASTYLHSLLGIVGANPSGPIFLCGHSYGGVAALLLAARYRAARPERLIRYLTFGCPKPGDTRVIQLLEQCQGICIANENDIVPTIPPDLTLIYALVVAVHFPDLFNWQAYRSAPNQVLMKDDGSQQFDANPELTFEVALTFAIYVIDTLPYPSVEQHMIDEYFKRSLLRCLRPEWPLTQADYNRILIP